MRYKIYALITFIFFLYINSFGQTTWLGGSSSDWATPGNWNPAAVPTSATDVIIPSGTSFDCSITAASECHDITINSGANVSISNTLTVYGNWTNNGTVNPGGSTIVFAGTENATVSGTSVSSITVLDENFETEISPGEYGAGWISVRVGGSTADWNVITTGGGASSSTNFVQLKDSDTADDLTELYSPTFDCSDATSATLTFYNRQINFLGDQDTQALYVSNNGSSWTLIESFTSEIANWTLRTYTLESYVTLSSTMQLKWIGNAKYGNGTEVDEVQVTTSVTPFESFYNFTINKTGGATVTLSSDISISNQITLTNGIINSTSTNIFTIEDGVAGMEGSATCYVDGPIKKIGNDAFTFPLGDGTVWAPFQISNLSADANQYDRWIVEYFDSNPDPEGDDTRESGLIHISSVEYWDVSTTYLNGQNVDVTLHWKDGSRSLIDNLSYLVVAHNSGTQWDNEAGTTAGDLSVGTITTTINTFSPITFGSNNAAMTLPVEWVDFHGFAEEENNVLRWTTASEINNDYFIIEKSKDGIQFSNLGMINGKGNYNGLSHYSYKDTSVTNKINYYRIKQVDYDGQYDYSKVLHIYNHNSLESANISYIANTNELVINFGNQTEQNWNILIIDYTGKIVYTNKIYNSSYDQFINFELPGLNRGLYLINLKSTSQSYTTRMLVD